MSSVIWFEVFFIKCATTAIIFSRIACAEMIKSNSMNKNSRVMYGTVYDHSMCVCECALCIYLYRAMVYRVNNFRSKSFMKFIRFGLCMHAAAASAAPAPMVGYGGHSLFIMRTSQFQYIYITFNTATGAERLES